MKIPMQPVDSSQIAAVGHHPESNTLAVQFADGGTYHYSDVSAEQHSNMLASHSIGKYFAKHIRPNSLHVKVRVRK